MSRRILLPGVLAATVGLLAVPASGGLARSADVSIAVTPTTVRYPGSVTISGRVTGVDNPLGKQVNLQSDAYPYAGFQALRHGTTAEDGSYTFTVAPRRNTRYQVVVEGPTSVTTPPVTAVALPTSTRSPCNVCHGSLRHGSFVVRQHGTLRFPPGVTLGPASRRLYVYAGFNLSFRAGAPARGTRLHLLGVRGTLAARGEGRYAWRLAFRAPADTRNFWFDNCYRDPAGFGPLNGRHSCGVLKEYRLPGPYLG